MTENIDTAIVTHLSADATIVSLATGGVWLETAPGHVASPFVIVSRRFSEDENVVGLGESTETVEYLVKAVDQSTSVTTVNLLAKAIRTRMKTTFEATGYDILAVIRTGTAGPFAELVDDQITWQHRGQLYEVVAVISV
ncbi:MAG: tail completion protein gp17 [Vicinamibacteraceae bacterium]